MKAQKDFDVAAIGGKDLILGTAWEGISLLPSSLDLAGAEIELAKETFSSSASAWLAVWAVAAGGETGGGVVAAGVTPGVVCVATATSPAAGVVVVVAGGVALACAGALAGGRTRRT